MTDIFKHTRGPRNARIAIVGESWGKEEDKRKLPFVGASGDFLKDKLASFNIDIEECFLTNLVNARPHKNNITSFFYETTAEAKQMGLELFRGLYPKGIILEGLDLLKQQIKEVNPDIIIGFGNYSLWALTDDFFTISNMERYKVPTGIGVRRGSQTYTSEEYGRKIPFVPMYHPAAAMRNYSWRRLIAYDISRRVKPFVVAGRKDWDVPEYNFTLRPSFADVMGCLDFLLGRVWWTPVRLSVDIETRGKSSIACIGIAWSDTDALCIPLMCKEDKTGYWSFDEEIEIQKKLKELFCHPNVRIIGQHFSYDMQYLILYIGRRFPVFMDTMIAWHTCWPGEKLSLDYISSFLCAFHVYWKSEGKEWDFTMPEEQLWSYNCMDAVRTFEIATQEEKILEGQNLTEQYKFMQETFDLSLDMMLNGLPVDVEAREGMQDRLDKAIKEREEWLEYVVTEEVHPRKKGASPWYTSPPQQMRLFYDTLGLPKQFNRKAKKTPKPLTANDAALETLIKKEPLLKQLFVTIQELRSSNVFFNNFLSAELDPDDRMRSSLGTGPETFRWRSGENAFGRGTNMQNLPKNRPKED